MSILFDRMGYSNREVIMLTYCFIDGNDGVGKTTLTEKLMNKEYLSEFNKVRVIQPNSIGPLGFIRDYVKSPDTVIPDDVRQCLHVCSHFNDYINNYWGNVTLFDTKKTSERIPSRFCYGPSGDLISSECRILSSNKLIFYDRGPFSTYAYAVSLGVEEETARQLFDMQINLLSSLESLGGLRCLFINLYHDHGGFRKESCNDYYENSVSQKEVSNIYKKVTVANKTRLINVTNSTTHEIASEVSKIILEGDMYD